MHIGFNNEQQLVSPVGTGSTRMKLLKRKRMNTKFQDIILCGYCGMQTIVIINAQRSLIVSCLVTIIVYFISYLFYSANLLFRPVMKSEKNSLLYICLKRSSSTAFKTGFLSNIYKYIVPDIQNAYHRYREYFILARYKSIAMKKSGFPMSLLKGHVLEVP